MMVDAESAERAFKKFYAKLTQALPINELVADLYANNLLPGRHKSKVDAISTQEEKAQYFLDEIIKPGLSIGYTGQFNKMISVMESSDNPVAEYLGKQVREWAIGASSSSDDDKNGESLNFSTLGSVKISFTRLSNRISDLLQKKDFFNLKVNCEKAITDMQIPEYLGNKIKSSGNTKELLSALILSPYWNWIDIRLMETVAAISDDALSIVRQYKEYLHPLHLVDHLSLIPELQKDITANYKIITTKIQVKIDDTTIKDFFHYRYFLETKILMLKEGACIVKNIKKESFEIDWFIPSEQCSHAYESAKGNLQYFNQISLLFVHIESYEKISKTTLQALVNNSVHMIASKPIEVESLATRMKKLCTLINNIPNTMPTYKLPIKQTMHDSKKGIAKYVLGTPIPGQPMIEKVLLIVGESYADKTILINGMINNIFGVKWEDNFRLMLAIENTAKFQAHSQINLTTAYTIYPAHGSNLEYALTIIDTPAFVDTRTLEYDKMVIQQLENFFSVKGSNGIDHLDGIGIVVQAALPKLTYKQNFTINLILSMFGSDMANNLFMIVTNADGNDPPVMAAIAEAKIECKKYYKFNNSALFASNKQNLQGDNDENVDKMFWKMGIIFYNKFFDEFSKTTGVSLYLTTEVLQEHKQVELIVQHLQKKISIGVAKLEELRQEEVILQMREVEIAANKDFKFTINVTKQRKIDLPSGHYVLNCLQCNYTCHEYCICAENLMKHKCFSMDGGGIEYAKCRICPGKCSWRDHVSNPYCFELYIDDEERVAMDLKNKYEKAMQDKNSVERNLQRIHYDLSMVEDDIISKSAEVRKVLQHLDNIALKQSPLTQVDCLNLLIVVEKQEGKPGYQRTIRTYEKAKQDAQILDKAKNNPEQLRILKEK